MMPERTCEQPHYTSLNDPELLQRIEDDVYADLEQRFGNDDYIVEAVTSEYISKEYLEEVAYNSKRNVFFGYTLEELDTQFAGTGTYSHSGRTAGPRSRPSSRITTPTTRRYPTSRSAPASSWSA